MRYCAKRQLVMPEILYNRNSSQDKPFAAINFQRLSASLAPDT
jgi:hypothetical protein